MKKQVFNPYLPTYEYVPDGEPRVFGDRVYLFGSHDRFGGDRFCMNDYVCWSAPVKDLSDWRYEGGIYRKEQDPEYSDEKCLYAPDVAYGRDGRYYLFYSFDNSGTLSVAVSDSPAGEYTFYGKVAYSDGHVLGADKREVYQFDPAVLVDDDGRVWLYTGAGFTNDEKLREEYFGGREMNGGYVVELEKDMKTVKAAPKLMIPAMGFADGTGFEKHPFFEASSIRKIGQRYYFVYSSTWSHELCYAVSQYPDRGFCFGGTLISNGDIGLEGRTMETPANYIGNNHGGMVEVNGHWYIFYHRQTNYSSFSRQGCAEPITILSDGSIRQVEMTSCGLNGGDLAGKGTYPAAIACQLYAKPAATTMDAAAANREMHPTFTQSGSDTDTVETQYITNLRNGACAVFKYFDLADTYSLKVKVRGSAGRVLVTDGHTGSTYAEIIAKESSDFQDYTAVFSGGTAHISLRFTFLTDGAMDFQSFTLAANSESAIHPGEIWTDTEGKRIEAHGGALYYENGTYYLYGENKDHTDGKSEIWTYGIRCYSSKDLINWNDEGFLIAPNLADRNSLLHPHFRMDRPHIVKSPSTGKYVCWLKYSGKEACFALLTAERFRGPYRLVREYYRPLGKKVGDFDIAEFEDKAVLFFDGDHEGILAIELTADRLEVTGEPKMIRGGLHAPFCREAPAYFNRSGKHYLITSGMTGYVPNPSETMISDALMGEYHIQGNPHRNDTSRASFNSQISKVFHVPDSDLYIALADRWCTDYVVNEEISTAIETVIAAHFEPVKYHPTPEMVEIFQGRPNLSDVNTSQATYVWLPVRFEGNRAVIDWLDSWNPIDWMEQK